MFRLAKRISQPLLNQSCQYANQNKKTTQILSKKLHTSREVFNFTQEAKTALRNFSDIKHAPAPALFYGIGGLVPFTAIPTYMIQSGMYIPEMAFTSMAYSAVILSFIGGVRWGSATSSPEIMKPDWKNFSSSIAPSVVGWMSLLVTNPVGSLMMMSGFTLCLLQDMTTTQFPSWYRSLRILLSTVAILALLSTLMCQYLLPVEEKK